MSWRELFLLVGGCTIVSRALDSYRNYKESEIPKKPTDRPDALATQVDRQSAVEDGSETPSESDRPKEKFEDVVGIELVIEEMKQIVDFIKNTQAYAELGAELPKGVLLTGPPGTGKTLLARALANEAGCTFLYKSGADFDHKYVGEGAKRVRKLFAEARKKAPTIIFIDEIDSVGGKRHSSIGPMNQTINQLLTEMDGFKTDNKVIVIGATNRSDSLDPALVRPGRFDKTIHVEPPNEKNRLKLFQYYLKKVKCDSSINVEALARESIGMTGADISNLVNIAAVKAVRQGSLEVQEKHLENALVRVRHGIYGKLNIRQNLGKIATYQAAKAVMILKEPSPMVEFVHATILPMNGVPGTCATVTQKEKKDISRADLIKKIDYNLIGRIMEEVEFGLAEVSQRGNTDLVQATKTAMKLLRNFDDRFLGLLGQQATRNISSENLYRLEEAAAVLIKEREAHVRNFIAQNQESIRKVAARLRTKETLRKEEIAKLIS